ncbi:hypothetical protein ABK040_011900 [Willaertia magna]
MSQNKKNTSFLYPLSRYCNNNCQYRNNYSLPFQSNEIQYTSFTNNNLNESNISDINNEEQDTTEQQQPIVNNTFPIGGKLAFNESLNLLAIGSYRNDLLLMELKSTNKLNEKKIKLKSLQPNYHDTDILQLLFYNKNSQPYLFTSSSSIVTKFDINQNNLSDQVTFSSGTLADGICIDSNNYLNICTNKYICVWDTKSGSKPNILLRNNNYQLIKEISEYHFVTTRDFCNLDIIDIRYLNSKNGLINFKLNNDIIAMDIHPINRNILIYDTNSNIYELINLNNYYNLNNIEDCIYRKMKVNDTNDEGYKNINYSKYGNYICCGSDNGKCHVFCNGKLQRVIEQDNTILQSIFIPNLDNEYSTIITSTKHQLTIHQTNEYPYIEKIVFPDKEDDDLMIDDIVEVELEDWQRNSIYETNQLTQNDCSYSLGNVDQVVYICLTCLQQVNRYNYDEEIVHGLCESCALKCHEMKSHEIYNIGMKRGFRCDCGNSKFNKKENDEKCCSCVLYPNKGEVNALNVYNHNFKNEWCYCNRTESLPMYQCIHCYDWFHHKCITGNDYVEGSDFREDVEYICENCKQQQNTDTNIVEQGITCEKGVFIKKNN